MIPAKGRAPPLARRAAALRDGSVVSRLFKRSAADFDNQHGEIADTSRPRSTSAFSFAHPVACTKIVGSFISAIMR